MKTRTQRILVTSVLLFSSQLCADLIDRGGGLIYDTDLNITWLQNTNFSGIGMTWGAAMAWTDAFVYEGYDDWRLPWSPATSQGFINEGEMGHLYYTALGNSAGGPFVHKGPFLNYPSTEIFWLSATPLHAGSAWNFEFGSNGGFQNASSSDFNSWFAWPVRDGDSTPLSSQVPESSSLALLLLAVACILLLRRTTLLRQRETPR